MSEACSKYAYKILNRLPERRRLLGGYGGMERLILKWTLAKQGMRALTGYIWHRLVVLFIFRALVNTVRDPLVL